MEWQPIESAPKDAVTKVGIHRYGERILASWPGRVGAAKWWFVDLEDGKASNFLDDGGNAVFPTHWAPLPEPPK